MSETRRESITQWNRGPSVGNDMGPGKRNQKLDGLPTLGCLRFTAFVRPVPAPAMSPPPESEFP